jgi:hypothetical protein
VVHLVLLLKSIEVLLLLPRIRLRLIGLHLRRFGGFPGLARLPEYMQVLAGVPLVGCMGALRVWVHLVFASLQSAA